MISILLNVLKFVSWPRIWSILWNVSRALEKDVHFYVVKWNILFMQNIFFQLMEFFRSFVSLLILHLRFCQFLRWLRGLRFPTIISNLPVSPFSSVSFCFMQFESLLLGVYTFKIVVLLFFWVFYHHVFEGRRLCFQWQLNI